MKYIVSKYNENIDWLKDYTDDWIIYDRGNEPLNWKNTIRVQNIGSDIRDKFTFIIDNYDNLPEVAVYTKGNLFKFISKQEFDLVCNNTTFTPLLTKRHTTYLPTCFYSDDGMYNEFNNSWYLYDADPPTKLYRNYNEYAKDFGLPITEYIKFAPGSNYIIPKENILKHSKDFYVKIVDIISYGRYPVECQMVERSLYEIFK
jgi:hypothetical protein